MNSLDAAFIAWVQQYWNWILFLIGALLVTGSTRDWDWLCDPTPPPSGSGSAGKPAGSSFSYWGLS